MENKKKRIVVMGGSFNPPTLAHYRLMRVAVDALCADIGFFVPVSDAYLKRKMSHSHPPVVLSQEMRVKMLQAICLEDSRLQVCEKELGTIEARTMQTLTAIQEDFPNADLYFVMGADKIDLLAHLTEKREFLDAFWVVLYSRENNTHEQSLKNHEILTDYQNRIVILPQPEGTEGVSSSLVRERMLSGGKCKDLLCPKVWELFKVFTPSDFPDAINCFKGDYAFLSNRFPCHFVWQGLAYGSAEAAFQSSKCVDETERKVLAGCSADNAAIKGRKIEPYPGWGEDCLNIMESILKAKFEQNSDLKKMLTDTGNSILINGNNKNDVYWGIDSYSWIGENYLGQLIMKIREKL